MAEDHIRPPPVPLTQRNPPIAPNTGRSTVGGLLSGKSPNGSTPIPPSLQAKMAAMAKSNSQPANIQTATSALNRLSLGDHISPHTIPRMPQHLMRGGLNGRRKAPGLKLSQIDPDAVPPPSSGGAANAGLGAGRPSMPAPPKRPSTMASPFANFSKIVDPSGALNFSGKAVLHSSGVDFSNGKSFKINMNQLELRDELGKGNYGTVKKVLHIPTNVEMAMKEIRLELDESRLNGIIMELDILHRAVAPAIVEFYGAFFIESCVYYCMEYMDAGSLDKLTQRPVTVPEPVLARMASSVVGGLKFLKDTLQIIHRDIKPTNILMNRRGQVKLCDFGVSGQLEKSLAKTNIGCQSYMAPERIKGESQNNLGTYTVSSDVWSLGLTIIEVAIGMYPYPPETYSNVFAQLSAIVHGDPPSLPSDGYSEDAREWVGACLVKHPEGRATYSELQEHPFLVADAKRGDSVDMAGWVVEALKIRAANASSNSPRDADSR